MKLRTLIAKSLVLSVMAATFAALAQELPPGAQRVPGAFSFDESTAGPVVVVPERVVAGQEFQVTITTVGGGCEDVGDNGVILGNRVANVHVYDFTTATKPGVACTLIFKQFKHTVTLSLPEAGAHTIRVWGRQTGRYYAEGGAPVALDVPITVVP
jgi:hypothetical protein